MVDAGYDSLDTSTTEESDETHLQELRAKAAGYETVIKDMFTRHANSMAERQEKLTQVKMERDCLAGDFATLKNGYDLLKARSKRIAGAIRNSKNNGKLLNQEENRHRMRLNEEMMR